MKIKISLFKLIIIMTIVFFTGYFVRSIHYRQDLPRLEKEHAEIRLVLEAEVSKLADVLGWLNQDVDEIIDQNNEHPVVVFIEEEE